MYHQPPPTEDEISRLPLDFALLESEFDRELFTDQLISIWIALAESGSLATLPPVPDIVGFAQGCLAFFLIYHTNTWVLKSPPGTALDSSTEPPPVASTSPRGSPSKDPLFESLPRNPKLDSSDTRDVIGCIYLSLSTATQNTVDVGVALPPPSEFESYASWSQVSPHPSLGARVPSPPIFSLDSDEVDPVNAWSDFLEPDVGGPGLEDEGLGFGLGQRRGR
ncbi:hypothetical protein FRC08_002350 [Ceratobasidium sp. 394]|nr:hypothetical protein FRC08_002350 [Ceratobasidium sp. 394]